MAPLLLGEHFQVTCDDCRYSFECDAARKPDNGMAVCPNCGFGAIQMAEFQPRPASTAKLVRVDRTSAKNIQRGDVVAFRLSGEPTEQIGVKRVVGLPGEKIQIRNGDIFVNNKLFSKPLDLQRSMRIPVFDSRYVPQNTGLPTRLVTDNASALWDGDLPAPFADRQRPGQSGGQGMPALDWITYRQWRCCRHNEDRTKEFPVEDYYAYNQARSRNLNPTDELCFRMEVECNDNAIVLFSIPHSGLRFMVSVNFETRTAAFYSPSGGQEPIRLDTRIGAVAKEIEISTIDHTLVLLVDGCQVIKQEIFFPGRINDVSIKPLGIASTKDTFHLKRLQIWRDVYYLNEGAFYADGDLDKAFVTDADQYILLGDNSPISSDSRYWEAPAVDANRILGKVVVEMPK